jgi:hypothetical protein
MLYPKHATELRPPRVGGENQDDTGFGADAGRDGRDDDQNCADELARFMFAYRCSRQSEFLVPPVRCGNTGCDLNTSGTYVPEAGVLT